MSHQVHTEALLVRAVDYREHDRVLTFVTADSGKRAVVARAARRSRRSSEPIEPFHTLTLTLEDRGGDLDVLREARVQRVRTRIATDLARLDAAGVALRWARHLFQPKSSERAAWHTLLSLLDGLEDSDDDPESLLAQASLNLLADTGFGLEFERCVRCLRRCPDHQSACLQLLLGGIVCVACGGTGERMGADLRKVAAAIQRGESTPLNREESRSILRLMDQAMATHTA